MKSEEFLNLIPCNEKGGIICQKIDEFHKNKDVIGCIKFLVEEIDCDENTAMHIYLILTNQEEVDYDLSPQQIAYNNQVAREWQNKPKCPTCGSTNVSKISATVKVADTVMFGIFGQKRKHQFKCLNCRYEW